MNNQLFELAAKRRSVRKYTDAKISDDVINEIMKVALAAPCSFGHRPVEFVVVRNKKTIRELAGCKRLGGSQIIGAYAVIVVMVELSRGEFWIEDGAVASGYILLAAEQYDVGRNRSSDEEIRELLGVPDGYAVLNLIALGGKGERKKGYAESDFDFSKVRRETF